MQSGTWFVRNIVYFAVVHLLPLGALISGADKRVFIAAAIAYVVRIWFVTAGYHCYFAHRAFKTSRAFQFLLAAGAQTSAQGSAIGWAAAHAAHHAHTDEASDLHSPHQRGFWYAHIGWLLHTDHLAYTRPRTSGWLRYPELAWLHRHPHLPWLAFAAGMTIAYGWPGLFIGYGLSTLLVYHATFAVNSLAHRFGSQRFATGDHSRNNWFVALIMLGGGWHNNHHRHPRSARQGIAWWEIDTTYLVLVMLGWAGVVSAIRVSEPAGGLRTRGRSHRRC